MRAPQGVFNLKNLCIITARGGSKRIPRKNIKDFLGKPIMAYPLKAALGSKLFDDIVVSTDDEEIADLARSLGASVPFLRSEKNSDDYATTLDVLEEVVGKLNGQGKEWEHICCLYPTSPFLTQELLEKSYQVFVDGEFDSLIPVVEYEFAPQRALRITKSQTIDWVHSEYALTRSQDLEKYYHDIGQFYWLKNSVVTGQSKILTQNTGYYEVEALMAQDIDTYQDWDLAEVKYKFKNNLFL